MKETCNVIELKEGSIEVINEQCLSFNDKKWIFKPFFDDCPLKVIQKEKEFNKDYTFGHAGPTTGVFGSYTRVVYIVDANKIIFNTDNDNLDDLLECENDGSYDSLPTKKYPFISVCTSDLIYELSKFAIKSFKIGFSQWTEASGMASMFHKYDLSTKKIKHEEVEQTNGIIRVINSVYSSKKTVRKNEMIDGAWVRKDRYLKDEIFEIAKEAGFKAEEMKFDDWLLDWINNPDDELYDSDMEVALYRPIYDLSCSDPIILAPEWW